MSVMIRGTLGGVVAGVIGAGIWAGIVYATNREVGIVAWGVGGLVGLGVRLLVDEAHGFKYGLLAAAIAFMSLIGGKFVAVHLIVSDIKIANEILHMSEQDMIMSKADDIVKERQAKKQRVNFAPGMTVEKASKQMDYPQDVWKEAKKRWTDIPEADRQKLTADVSKERERLISDLKTEVRNKGFAESFGPYDLLWFGLAMFTAFRLGSGLTTES